jgi:ubiquinone/menaquinone biosynthesis C-methylase UbiE
VEQRKDADVLLEVLDLAGKRVLDVGCGPGGNVRLMAGAGAKVTGLECGALPLAKAKGTAPASDEDYVEGVGEDMPFDDSTFDVVVFSKSLHHVPMDNLEKALGECARVLAPGGVVYIAEPLAEGSSYELGRLLDDEKVVRAAALKALKNAGRVGLTETQEITYNNISTRKDFEFFRNAKILVDADMKDMILGMEDTLRTEFERLGRKTDAGYQFDQPMRVNLFQKSAT